MIRTKPYEINDESESKEEEFSEEYYHDDDETTIDSITTTEESFTTDWNIVDIFETSTTLKSSTKQTPNSPIPKNPSIRSWSNTTVIKCEQFCNLFFLGHLIFCLFTDNEIEAKIDDHILAQQLQK